MSIIDTNSPPFFVISGADGVGKTTATDLAETLLTEQGMDVCKFHHMLNDSLVHPHFKGRRVLAPAKRPVRPIWRLLIPRPMKILLTSLRDEYKYMVRLNRVLAHAEMANQIALCDRYVYDRLTTLRIKKRSLIHRLTVRIVCSLLRKPTLNIIITEDPQIIVARRQELSKAEIFLYQSQFIKFCQTIKVPLLILPAAQRSPTHVAEELSATIVKFLKQ